MLAAVLVMLTCSAGLSGPRDGGPERAALPPQETITAIQIHGNTITPDEEVRRLAGLDVGAPVTATTVEDVLARLRASKRFEKVDVLKRFASITDPSQIMLVIVVDDGPVHITMTGDPDEPAKTVRNRFPRLLFLPVLNAEDGYGPTYGMRFALSNPAGTHSRVAFPLTWGGEKRAAIEFDKQIEHFPIDRVLAGGSVSRRTNPFFEEDDDRAQVWVRAEREIVHTVRVAATTGWQRVAFANGASGANGNDRFVTMGGDVVVDTRVDPVLARNAVYAKASWEHLSFSAADAGRQVPDGANRTSVDARGYLGLIRQNILAVRVLRQDSDVALPAYLKPLLGGMDTLRGFHAGTAVGDTLVAMSAEFIVPLTSPLKVGKVGVSAFTDRGTVYNKGDRFADQTLKEGYGGSVWFAAAFFRLNLAVAHGVGATTRVHVGATASF